jgi:hypothetical protein
MIQLKEHNIDKQTPSPLLERNLERITTGLPALFNLLQTIPKDNASVIADYILAMKTETNMSDDYRRDNIVVLTRFSKSINNKPFKDVKREDIVAFLESFRKSETSDPLHQWIGTYNLFRTYLMRFFKWLYSPDVDANRRRKPEVIQNIPKLRRKEHSIYKPTDLWTLDDDLLFLRYCASKRIKCYHAVAMERL